jgi:protoheme IX farnesyltransferase
MTVAALALPAASNRLRAYVELTKPGITRLVLVTTAAGFYLATRGAIDFQLLLNTLIGTGLAASGCNALNQYVERAEDARMNRTSGRPLPSGRLTPGEALTCACGLSVVGTLYLLLLVNLTTALVVLLSLTSYIFVYTPLKQRTPLSTIIGAVPGALPIVAGWTATGARIDAVALALFGILFLWQMPHFFALAWIYREDYRRGGFKMLSVLDPLGRRTGRQILAYSVLLIPVTMLPTRLGLTGHWYLAGALVLGVAFLALSLGMVVGRNERRAWRLFMGSVLYLPALLILMVFDKMIG